MKTTSSIALTYFNEYMLKLSQKGPPSISWSVVRTVSGGE